MHSQQAKGEYRKKGSLLFVRHVQPCQCDDGETQQCEIRNDAEDDGEGNLPISRDVAFSVDRGLWIGEFQICALPIVICGDALKDEVDGCADEPEDGVDKVDPPEDAEPALIDKEDAAVEEKEAEFDAEEAGAVEDGCNPYVLAVAVNVLWRWMSW